MSYNLLSSDMIGEIGQYLDKEEFQVLSPLVGPDFQGFEQTRVENIEISFKSTIGISVTSFLQIIEKKKRVIVDKIHQIAEEGDYEIANIEPSVVQFLTRCFAFHECESSDVILRNIIQLLLENSPVTLNEDEEELVMITEEVMKDLLKDEYEMEGVEVKFPDFDEPLNRKDLIQMK